MCVCTCVIDHLHAGTLCIEYALKYLTSLTSLTIRGVDFCNSALAGVAACTQIKALSLGILATWYYYDMEEPDPTSAIATLLDEQGPELYSVTVDGLTYLTELTELTRLDMRVDRLKDGIFEQHLVSWLDHC